MAEDAGRCKHSDIQRIKFPDKEATWQCAVCDEVFVPVAQYADMVLRPITAGHDFTCWAFEEATIEELRIDVLHLASAARERDELQERTETWRTLIKTGMDLSDILMADLKKKDEALIAAEQAVAQLKEASP